MPGPTPDALSALAESVRISQGNHITPSQYWILLQRISVRSRPGPVAVGGAQTHLISFEIPSESSPTCEKSQRGERKGVGKSSAGQDEVF